MRTLLFLLAASTLSAQLGPCTIERVAGGGTLARGDGGPAVEAELFDPRDVRVGPDGLLYIADTGHHRIRRIRADGVIETFAGTGVDEISGDGGRAIDAGLASPRSMAFTPDGSLYFLDFDLNSRLRRIAPDGRISSVVSGPVGDGGRFSPTGIAAGPDGSIFVVSQLDHRIWRIGADGAATRFAGVADPSGLGRFSGDGGPAIEAELNRPGDIAVDSGGIVYFVDRRGAVVRGISADGTIDSYLTVPGTGVVDGTLRTDVFYQGLGQIEIDHQGRLYWKGRRGISRIGLDDRLENLWTKQSASRSIDIFVAPDGTIYRTRPDQVLKILGDGDETLVAGVGLETPRGDGGPALQAAIRRPLAVAPGPNGEIYIADVGRVRIVRGGVIEAFAGTGALTRPTEGGHALDSGFLGLTDVAVGPEGLVYIATLSSVYRVDDDGTLSRVAGQQGVPTCRFFRNGCGEGGPAVDAQLGLLRQIVFDSDANLYIRHGDGSGRETLRKVGPDGTIVSVPSLEQRFADVTAIAEDGNGGLLVATGGRTEEVVARRLSPDGALTPIEGLTGFVNRISFIAGDHLGNVYLNDFGANIRRLTPDGILETFIAPGPDRGEPRVGMPSGDVLPTRVIGLATDQDSNLYVATLREGVLRINRPGECEVRGAPLLALRGLVNGASFGPNLAPGTIVSIFGVRLGPTAAVGARIDNGRLTTELGGVRVLVDGVPAAMIFALDSQINAIHSAPDPRPGPILVLRTHHDLRERPPGPANGRSRRSRLRRKACRASSDRAGAVC